ncbi:receptor-like protein kinase FERONIA [Phaseolus vulgaris]|uniref:receptor-like protein kinase FERONIA n=1 Tax=Phaseolus vulgaris TaxID=3885 RepID=UPI0035C9B429
MDVLFKRKDVNEYSWFGSRDVQGSGGEDIPVNSIVWEAAFAPYGGEATGVSVDWAKHRYQKGSLGEIVDPALKGQITQQCLHKFGEVALTCLLEDGTQRPSMNDIVGMLEFVLQLQESANNGVIKDTCGGYENSEDMFSSSHSSVQLSDYSDSTRLNTTTDDSYGSKQSDRLLPENVFSQIGDPKGR